MGWPELAACCMQWLLRLLRLPGAEVPALGHELQHLLGRLGLPAGLIHPAPGDAELTWSRGMCWAPSSSLWRCRIDASLRTLLGSYIQPVETLERRGAEGCAGLMHPAWDMLN